MRRWRNRRGVGGDDLSATEWMHRGAKLLDTDLDAAERCYMEAVESDGSLSGAWFDLGLIAKWRLQWAECVEFNMRAASLAPASEQAGNPAYWNAGIAATALRDWATARWAWRSFGIPIADGDGAVAENFGLGVVRLPGGETVWGKRLDPARMQLLSIPLPDDGFRTDDIVLHDGQPVGSRVSGGREYSVFNVIERWQGSPVPTISVEIIANEADVAELLQRRRLGSCGSRTGRSRLLCTVWHAATAAWTTTTRNMTIRRHESRTHPPDSASAPRSPKCARRSHRGQPQPAAQSST